MVASLSIGVFALFPGSVQASARHRQSELDYARATAVQRRLQAIPPRDRTRSQYERTLDAYRAVYHSDPASPDAGRAIAAVADLLANEGRCFRDAKLLHDAVAQWEFLRHQYPGSPLRQRALLEEGKIEQQDLHDRAAARKAYHLFLKDYPQDSLADQARAGLHGGEFAESVPRGRLTRRSEGENTEQHVRVAESAQGKIPAGSGAGSQKALLTAMPAVKPTRIAVAATSAPAPATIQNVRYWAEDNTTRIAVDITAKVPYRAYSTQGGRQIAVIFFGAHPSATLLGRTIVAQNDELLSSTRIAMLTGDQAVLTLQMKRPASFTSFVLSNPARLIFDLHPALAADFAERDPQPVQQSSIESQNAPARPIRTSTSPRTLTVAHRNTDGSAQAVAPSLPFSYPVEPTANVQGSMARVLGLRIRRIVIDAGHGGHDSGTIGPDGLEEKDVALDVALRLGRLLQRRLGAEVIYTRRTDKFVPLEERTAIANAAHADLFLSIHANSSTDPRVRGVETYFLNFTASPDAMAVAARENADSNRSVYQLSDLVRKIALSDKIDESRELAADVQQQLYDGAAPGNAGMKNRGVKQAPFVVLIGAQMPSILAEISFLTNPEDAAELSRPAYRERLAEALYRGVAEYVQGMSGIRVAKSVPGEALSAPAE